MVFFKQIAHQFEAKMPNFPHFFMKFRVTHQINIFTHWVNRNHRMGEWDTMLKFKEKKIYCEVAAVIHKFEFFQLGFGLFLGVFLF